MVIFTTIQTAIKSLSLSLSKNNQIKQHRNLVNETKDAQRPNSIFNFETKRPVAFCAEKTQTFEAGAGGRCLQFQDMFNFGLCYISECEVCNAVSVFVCGGGA